jgi:hypothetical protein
MSEQSVTAGKSAGDNKEAEPKALGVDDIPGAVMPGEALAEATGPAADGGGKAALNERLAAFRERRAAQGGGQAGPGAGGGRGGAGGGRGGAGRGRGQGQGLAGRGGAGGGGGGPGMRARAGGGAGGGGPARAAAEQDPIAAGRKILDQLNTRLADAGDDKRPMQYAIQTIAKGYDALEKEVERLRGELERAHEAVRTVQREGD